MEYKYICPFCKGLFKQNEVHPHKAMCVHCDLELNGVTKTISLGYASPSYVRDAFTFIEEFLKSRPHLAFGLSELYSETFDINDVVVFTDKPCSLNRADDGISVRGLVDNCTILGGDGRLAHGIVADTINSLMYGAYNNPFVWNVNDTAEHTVFRHMLLQFQHKDIPLMYRLVVNAYFRATLEAKVQDLYKPFDLYAMLPDVDDQLAIFSLVTNKPHITIGWEPSVDKLMAAEENYVECLLKDLDQVSGSGQLSEFLSVMPSTAINGGKSAFDILNNEYAKPTEMTTASHILAELFKKLTREEQQLGWAFKCKYVGTTDSNEDMVLQFWKKVKEQIM